MYKRLNIIIRTSIGFGIGGVILTLWMELATTTALRETSLLLPLSILVLALSGVSGGLALAYKRELVSSSRIVIGFGAGFSLGGFIAVFSVYGLCFGVADAEGLQADIFYDFYPIFILGFMIAGAVSAAIVRSPMISVLRATASFAIGSAVGGMVIGAVFKLVWHPGFSEAYPGVIVSYIVGGAVIGFLSQWRGIDSGSGEAEAEGG